MKDISWHKRVASYLWDIHIESCSSEYNPDLHVLLSKGRYQLVTDRAIYSHEDLYDNFSEVLLEKLDLKSPEMNKVLVLGLGLGSIPIILDQLKVGAWDITAVEIDEVICELAFDYAYPKINSKMDTIVADAYQFVQHCKDHFDLICVDLFVGEHTPQKFRSNKFLGTLKGLLSDDGVIVYNTLAFTKKDKQQSEDFFKRTFQKVFDEAEMIYAHKNYMLISNSRWFS